MNIKLFFSNKQCSVVCALFCFALVLGCIEMEYQGVMDPNTLLASMTYEYVVNEGGEYCELNLKAGLVGASWINSDCQSLRLKIELSDKEWTQILYGGEHSTLYRIKIGQVDAGQIVQLTYDEERSLCQTAEVHIDSISINYVDTAASRLIYQLSPLIEPAKYNDHSDVPLGILADPQYNSETDPFPSEILYTLLYSNEDGGTGILTRKLIDSWGRTTDLETCLRVFLDENQQVTNAVYQGAGHSTLTYGGDWIEGSPVLAVATNNGMFSDQVMGGPYLSIAPYIKPEEGSWFTREQIHNRIDGAYRIMAEEMIREAKCVIDGEPNSIIAGDIRYYLYLDNKVSGSGSWEVYNSAKTLLGSSSKLGGKTAIFIGQSPANHPTYLYFNGSFSSIKWIAAGLSYDLSESVSITKECYQGSIDNIDDPCLIFTGE